jgi:DNA replication protein DnaC
VSTAFADFVGCAVCEGSLYRIVADGEEARAMRCACVQPCPSCSDCGMSVTDVDGDRIASPCGCRNLDLRIQLYNNARIPGKFAGRWIDDLEDTHKSQREVKYALLKHRDSYSPGDPGFLLWGEPGIGKTHLMCGLLAYLTLERGISGRYIDIMQLMMELKRAWAQGGWESDVISPLLAAHVLVIDELGKGRNSDFELAILDQLISSRYNAGRTLHCTSNYLPEGEEDAHGQQAGKSEMHLPPTNLKDRVGERIFSRLNEMCRFVRVQGTDYRRRKQRRFTK